MTTIKAREITPGMVIEWMDRDVLMRMTVKNYSNSLRYVWSHAGVARHLDADTEVTVIAAPPVIPPEPEALGARVKAGNKLFLRVRESGYAWLEVTSGPRGLANTWTWEGVTKVGTVTVIDGDPSWEVETSEDTPEQWYNIETALKHCDKVKDKEGDTWYYENGDLHLAVGDRVMEWPFYAHEANSYGPFRRV